MRVIYHKDKERARTKARQQGRKVIWKDVNGYWHAALDRANTPGPKHAVESEDVDPREKE